ncbi:MAG TPA: serine hydrolase domain-containing protein [Cyclobacteriaceae bacterium]|nr:beta-lactamase family protein [Cyclobacteriaceae bacterium]HMV09758.1 serine hydrolase domain-containing protein [Cyclobacteriaceae bacterium]HMV88795.1 serine hydrolase domain-containing protein [Cyclobacteriaceae bacterium]HMX02311.1 serine hydrolase domain-containing protein [Cyclobacteriaceae bacterium]HMX52203.1 serine hydrolase domain-containing protein [Cyclobacteriaceae bacterium]
MKKYILIVTLLIPILLYGQENEVYTGISAQKLKNLDRVLQRHVDKQEFGGFVTLIARNGKIAQTKAYGFSDVTTKTKMDTGAIIPIASMTKIVTTLAVLILYEEGWFKLNDPIEKYIPEFKDMRVLKNPEQSILDSLETIPAIRKITIRNLLNHTSGLTYSAGSSAVDELYRKAGFQTWNKSLKEFVSTIAKMPLLYQPGQNWEYSYSHDILGYLVEVISHKPLNEFCQERIFTPLGMTNTDFNVPSNKLHRFPQLYQYTNGLKPEPANIQTSYAVLPKAISGGGGWYTSYGGVCTTIHDFYTITDLILNYGRHNKTRLVSRKSIELMISNQVEKTENMKGTEGYGLGIGVRIDSRNYGEISSQNEVYWAGGPYNSFFWIDFQERMIGILYTNTGPFAHLNIMNRYKILAVQSIDD